MIIDSCQISFPMERKQEEEEEGSETDLDSFEAQFDSDTWSEYVFPSINHMNYDRSFQSLTCIRKHDFNT